MVGRYEPTNRPSGYRVYISSKDYEILQDILMNDINWSDYDDRIEVKERLISKLLGHNVKEGEK